MKHRWGWREVGIFLVGAVFAVGLLTISSQALGWVSNVMKSRPKAKTGVSATPVVASTTSIEAANFNYLSPSTSPDWSVLAGSQAFDKAKNLVKYTVVLNNNNVHVTVSQQVMPTALKPRSSKAFADFIAGSKVSRSQDAGAGTLYFLPALVNGAVANGSDTVIYATDDVLLFGRSEAVIGYEAWAKLISAMRP